MAYTVVRTNSVFGDQGAVMLKVTADAATQNIETGLKSITGVSIAKISMNSANQHFGVNSGAGGTALAGVLSVSGCTVGDLFFVTVFGPR